MTVLEQLASAAQMVPLAFGALFPVINPLGTAIILLGLTGAIDKPTRIAVAKSIAVNSFILMAIILLAGTYILSFFGITIPVVQAAGGLVLASMGWGMLKQDDKPVAATASAAPVGSLKEQLFYPFSFPLTVGPGGVAVTLTLSAHSQHEQAGVTVSHMAGALVGIAAICCVFFVCFAYSNLVAHKLGPSGVKVLLRLMAFVLVCLGAEIFWNGAAVLLHQAIVSAPVAS